MKFVCFNSLNLFALGQTRTDTPEALDPKSSASTNSATRACKLLVFLLTKTIDLQLYLSQPLSVKPGLGVVSAKSLDRDETKWRRIFNAGTPFFTSQCHSATQISIYVPNGAEFVNVSIGSKISNPSQSLSFLGQKFYFSTNASPASHPISGFGPTQWAHLWDA